MHVQSETELLSFHDWTLRMRAASEGPARLLLLVHGWTGDENSMWVFVRNFPARYWIVAPRARATSQIGTTTVARLSTMQRHWPLLSAHCRDIHDKDSAEGQKSCPCGVEVIRPAAL